AIAAAIKRAQEAARKEALAKAAEEERRRKDAEKEASKNEAPEKNPVGKATKNLPAKPTVVAKKQESILLNSENIALNASFEKNRHSLPWPLDRGVILMHYGHNTLGSGTVIDVASVTISADIGTPVKAVFDGTVTAVQTIEDMQVVIIQHGRYFTTY